jgi:hypothetical protein
VNAETSAAQRQTRLHTELSLRPLDSLLHALKSEMAAVLTLHLAKIESAAVIVYIGLSNREKTAISY